MLVEIERVFSATKRLIITDRNKLTDETIEQLSLLRYWYIHGIIPDTDDELHTIKRRTFRLDKEVDKVDNMI